MRKYLPLAAWLFVVIMGAVGLWSIQHESQLREERVCEAFTVFTDVIGSESDAEPERIARFKTRLLDELHCG